MPDFITSDGLRLHYADCEGQAAPLPVRSDTERHRFRLRAPHLADVLMIALDYRGRSYSGAPESYTIETEARDVLELLDHLGLDRVAFLGTSRGGLIALFLAARAGDRLSGIMLNDIGPEIAPEGLTVIMEHVCPDPVERTLAEAAQARSTLMAGFDGVPADRWAEEVARHYVDRRGSLDQLRPCAGRRGARQYKPDDGPVAVLRGRGSPALCCAEGGGGSDILTAETGSAAASAAPSSRRAPAI